MAEQSMASWVERRALGMSCISTARMGGQRDMEAVEWGGSLPELMLYQVVRYCSMGPDGGFLREELRVGEKMWEWHGQ